MTTTEAPAAYTDRPFRSVLYIPGSKSRAIEKAAGLACDAIIFDLEDAVAPAEKAAAREAVARALVERDFGPRSLIVRINGLDTPWAEDDLAALGPARPEAILLPKVGRAGDIHELETLCERVDGLETARFWAMIETPAGVLRALEIAEASPRMAGFVMGTNDLEKELGARWRPDRLPMLGALSTALAAARAAGLVAVDGVYNAFRDTEGLRAECVQGRDLGFDGKTLIHPLQLPVANEVFAPDPEALDLARRQIAAFEEAEARGQGVAVLDGRIVENLHVATARRLLARAEAIARLEAALAGAAG
ncbi:MAG: CoA ester lyase [Alphaproteobacteria bacterium]|nr:MAG: CoA ester lyase [Alphaproteobacteria bacterium]